MSNNNSSSSSQQASLQPTSNQNKSNRSNTSNSSLVRRLSKNIMLSKAKDTAVSFVQDVFDKRNSLDSKPESAALSSSENIASLMSSPNQLSTSSSLSSLDKDTYDKVLGHKKHYSLPIRRPFTIRKDDSQDSSAPSLDSAAAAEAAILSGVERPGHFATACDFRLASEKRNEEFHALFKSVEVSDLLIQDYKCALQKEILLQGHIYVSEHHVCFKSNIFGWVTNLVIHFSEITQVEKKMTAKFIPNGITISTNTSKHVFASFISRDQAYDQIAKMWNLYKRTSSVQPPSFSSAEDDDSSSAQSIISTDSAVVLLATTTSALTTATTTAPQINTDESKDQEKINNESATTVTIPNHNDFKSFVSQLKDTQRRPRAVSDSFREHYAVEPKVELGSKRETRSQQKDQQYIVPIKKTRVCPCTIKGEQYPTIALNETYNGNTEDMFTLLFDSDLIKAFLEKFENYKDVQLGEWRHGIREVVGRRKIKSSSVGSRTVKTVFQQTRINRKYPYYVCVTGHITTPEMPMGSVYSIKSRTCITRVNKHKVHVLVTFQVAFTKSGLISSIIEKNASDEQIRMYSRLNSVLNRPDLIREIVKDEKVLEMFKPNVIQTKRSLNWSYCVYTFFIIAALTHCLLAIRLQRITKHLELVQQLKHTPTESHWINHKMYTLQQKLDKLKGEVQSYDQRILNLKKSIN